MKKIKLLFTGLLLVVAVGFASAQNIQVTGTVTDAKTGEPVVYASVQLKGTVTGAATDLMGKYTISAPSTGTLIFSFIGYTVVEVPINGRTVVNVALSQDAVQLEDVLVVAYGTTRKESFTGSAEVIKSEKIERRTVSNVTKAVEGLATGVLVTSGSGQPGSASSIIIRGYGSINASTTPLYVVDGVPYDGSISAINPADIESMTILKDASAGALYGSRGANGVVMITTKRGAREGERIKVNFRSVWGVTSRAFPSYELLDEKEWMEYQFQSYKNEEIIFKGANPATAGVTAIQQMLTGPSKIFGLNEQYNPYNFPLAQLFDTSTGKIRDDATLRYNEDWMETVTASNPVRQDHILTVTGGSEKAKYMASVGYLNENGILQTTAFKRYSGRANVDAQPNEWLKFGLNTNFAQTTSNFLSATGSATSNVWYSCMLMAPIYPVYILDAAGAPVLDANGKKQFDYGNNRASGAQQNYNSVATLYDDKFKSVNSSVSGRTYVELLDFKTGPIRGLKLSANLGFDFINQMQHNYENPYFGNAAGSSGRAYKYSMNTLSKTFNQLISFKRTFAEKHNLDVLAGHESYSYLYNYMMGAKSGFPFGGLYELSAAATVITANSYEDNYTIESYLSRLNYNYADRYYISGSFRRDGSSRFYSENRWGDFWSVGGNWRVSQESFMQGVSWINNMNVRASFGVQGNDAVGGLYPWQALYDLGFPNAGRNGAVVASIENTNLKWEKNENLNIGIDARMFNRVSISAEWYKRVTKDMLMAYPLAMSTGFISYNKNIGSMQNTGVEVSISGDIVANKDLRWTMTVMGSTVQNKVLNLADKPEITSGNYITKEGEVLNSFYLPRSAGVDPATGYQLYWVWDVVSGVKSDPYISADKAKAAASRVIAGNRMPKLYGSINNDFKFFGVVDLSVLCTYSLGGKILDGLYGNLLDPLYQGNSLSKHLLRAWQKPGDITDIPIPQLGANMQTSDRNLTNASFFSIKNVTLGYSLPKKWMTKIGVESVRISAIADNILLFSYLQGMNPQYNFSGGTDYAYTPTRSISLGLDITF
ncbi:MAG: SusC/RagA family TonB-linked outer membrane protein [Bacteroidetes bacterium HGW-Bacteroidetes-5]|jgi:TonB-linked SusC/RagA family outer membrane protein|nr:MAG: SusC/RagA family TonB-linked outer membrane protein [Bacteroidetes bacterium HGW-Bacteroidetes-5]